MGPPICPVLTLLIPRRACWLLVTSGPSWNRAPPPLIENEKLTLLPSSTVNRKSSELVLIDNSLASPVASIPLTVASISTPVSRSADKLAPNVPAAPSVITSILIRASLPYAVEVNVMGAAFLGMAALIFVALISKGKTGVELFFPLFFAVAGASALGSNLLRLPRWATEREGQMEHIAGRAQALLAAPQKTEADGD